MSTGDGGKRQEPGDLKLGKTNERYLEKNSTGKSFMQQKHIHFVTGRLAEHALRRMVARLAPEVGFDYSIDVLNITVAALMTPSWVAQRIDVPAEADRVLLPGYCEGDLAPVERAAGAPAERGPRDLRRLPDFFGTPSSTDDYGEYDIEILAEINHCPRLSLRETLDEAARLRADGADIIDVGCEPGQTWSGVAAVVRALADAGHRVSIDSFDRAEIEAAVRAGAELVLSVNSTNRQAAVDWGAEVVVVPDESQSLVGLEETVAMLAEAGVRLRIDPVLDPIGCGFAAGLGRYLEVRRRWPDAEMMMGVGNLTELTEVDSAGVNVLLLGFCQELGIRSVLTTQVINWARSSVRECDLGRRLVHFAHRHRTPPKNLDPRLVVLRDEKILEDDRADLERLAAEIKDNNYRIVVDNEKIHLISGGLHLEESDPFLLFERLLASGPDGGLRANLDASHAFYLGYEMCKAATARTLGKQYQQDEALDWGFLTEPEKRHRLEREKAANRRQEGDH